MRYHWLKALGHAAGPLPDAWLEDENGPRRLRRTGFPRRPRMEQSHIGLRPESYALAVEVLASVAA